MPPSGRQRVQLALRLGGLAFVLAWIFSGRLQVAIPLWLPVGILAATELEFLFRGLVEARRGRRPAPVATLERRLPGMDDADLGWIEVEGEDGEPLLVPAPPSPQARSRVLPLALAALIGAALLALALHLDTEGTWSSLDRAERTRAEQRFTREAAAIAGKPVTVRCDDSYAFTGVGSDAAGVAFPRHALAYLEPQVCRTLRGVTVAGAAGNRESAALAITVLAHEAIHLRGVRDEARTECYAIQEGVRLGVRLGLDPATARALMRSQLERDLGDASLQRLAYRLPAGCRAGGSLDLHPGDPAFP